MRKWLDKKAKVNFKIYDLPTWEQAITIYIIHNISRRKGNQTIKFDQLTEHNMRKIFLQKSCRK